MTPINFSLSFDFVVIKGSTKLYDVQQIVKRFAFKRIIKKKYGNG